MLDESHPVHFFNRTAEPDRQLPSLARLRSEDGEEGEVYFGPSGLIEIDEEPLVRWADYSRLDRMSVRWMLGVNPLPESFKPWTIDRGDAGDSGFTVRETLLGPYISDLGAVVVFGSEQWAEYFGLTYGILEQREGEVIPVSKEGYQVRPVEGGIIGFLDEVYSRHGPCVDIGLNPRCHRFRQGYFFKSDEFGWCLRTLSGVFRIGAEGSILPCLEAFPPKGDTVGQGWSAQSEMSGVASVTNRPFRRLFGNNRSTVGVDEANTLLKKHYQACSRDYTSLM
jgi:hypothetical protein